VTTQVGEGATFTIYLPVVAAVAPTTSTSLSSPLIEGQGETILVVEDEPNLRAALVEAVEMMNYRTRQAANGRQALDILEEEPTGEIAAVLSDLIMPEMGGQALLEALRQRGLTLPVVILSGYPLQSEMADLQALGLTEWLLKPPELEPLARALARAMGRQSR
jgi:CheY-like chemotaxis protein